MIRSLSLKPGYIYLNIVYQTLLYSFKGDVFLGLPNFTIALVKSPFNSPSHVRN